MFQLVRPPDTGQADICGKALRFAFVLTGPLLHQTAQRPRLTDFILVGNYPIVELNMWHMFKVIRSNIEITIYLKFGTDCHHITAVTSRHYRCSRSKGQRSRSQYNVRCEQ